MRPMQPSSIDSDGRVPFDAGTPMFERDYSVAGRVLRVATSGDLALQLSASFMRSCCFPAAESRAQEAETGIRVHSDGVAPVIPDGAFIVPMPTGQWRMTATEQFFELADSIVRVRRSGRPPVDVWIGTSPQARRRLALAHVMAHAVHAALRRCALYSFHGAGLAPPQGSSGLLVAGGSGTGKSTLALRLAQAGWRYLGDDSLLLYETASGVEVSGLRRPFAVSSTTVAAVAWPRLGESLGAPVLDDPDKRWVSPDELFPGQAVPSMHPAMLLFSTLADEHHSRLSEVRPAEALSQLIRTRLWAGGGEGAEARRCLRVLGQLVRQVRSYQLLAGRDLLESPDCAAGLLGPLLER